VSEAGRAVGASEYVASGSLEVERSVRGSGMHWRSMEADGADGVDRANRTGGEYKAAVVNVEQVI
jgi:hypothetical protein